MTVHVAFVELGEPLRPICDHEYDLTAGSGLPAVGDIVHLYDKKGKDDLGRTKQFWVVERHWNIGNVIGMVTIYVVATSEQARAIQ